MQLLLNQLSKLFRFQNLTFRAKAEYPAFDFVKAGDPEGDFKTAVSEFGYLLALVPDLLSHPPGPTGGDTDLYCVKLIMHHPEAVAHEIVQSPHAKAQRTQS